MKALRFYGPQDIRVEETAVPEINDNEVLLRVRAAAICGTDLRIYKFGHFKIPEGQPRVLGHELAGEIAAVGKNVKGYAVGQRVALPPNVGCGHCEMCAAGFNQLCADYEAFGISYDGGFQEYMRVPAVAIERGNLVPLPGDISFEEAAMVEPFSCTYHSWKALRTAPGDTVVVIGAGPIGACHVMINRLAGASKVIAADVSDQRLGEIVQFGADVTVNSATEDLAARVLAETGGRGADVVITACSVPDVQQTALEIAAVHGRVNFFGGMPKGREVVPLNTNLIHYKELVALGTTGSSITDYMESMKLAAGGRLNLAPLATARFSLADGQKAFDAALAGSGMKTLFVMEGK